MASKPTVDYEAYVSTVREKNKRIAALEAQLAQTKSGWDSCIADLRKATEICKETEDQMAEAKRARESFAGMWRRSCLEVNELEELLEKSERELAEARRLAQWTPITSENLPTDADEVYCSKTGQTRSTDQGARNPIMPADAWAVWGWTHFRPITPPQEDTR